MTELEAMDGLDRMVAAGFVPPDLARPILFQEWYRHVRTVSVADLNHAITKLAESRELRFWPTPAEFKRFLPNHDIGQHQVRCLTCHDTKWVDATPYHANGNDPKTGKPLVYEGVIRCPDCGTPAPNIDHLAGRQTPLTEAELMALADEAAEKRAKAGHPPVGIIRTHEDFLAKLGELKHRLLKPMPHAPYDPNEPE